MASSDPETTYQIQKVKDSPDVDKRHAGCGAVVGDQLYLWGGITEDPLTFSDEESSEEDEEPVMIVVNLPRPSNERHPFDVLDLTSLTWSRQNTCGIDVPNLGTGSTLSYDRDTHSMYLYGGWNNEKFSSDMYCVSMDTWLWEKLLPKSKIKPSPRYLTGVLMYEGKLCNFGGVGPDIVRDQDEGAKYKNCVEKNIHYLYGWNNEYYEFDTLKREWKTPMSGTGKIRPPPLGGHTFTRFDKHHAVCFGGRTEKGKVDTTYVFDLEKKEFQGPLSLGLKPPYRTFATLCPLVDPDMAGESLCPGGPPVEQTLLLLWGKESPNVILKDCWLFHCAQRRWTMIDLEDEVERYWHIACSYFCHPGKSTEGQVVIYGGARQDPSVAKTQFIGMGDLMILSFGTKTLKNHCLSVIASALQSSGRANPSLLCDQLPGNIPTTIKHSITKAYKAHVLTS